MNAEIPSTKLITNYSQQLLMLMDKNMSRSTEIHLTFLKNQFAAIEAMSKLSNPRQIHPEKKIIFSKEQLEEFASGSIAACFGPDYAILDHRPSPRIPNERLQLIDRVIDISGTRMQIAPPATIITEVDIPVEAWYLPGSPCEGLPLSILMEIALQPCGVLSAYLGTSLVIPPDNHIFRNLDGWISFLKEFEPHGKTITNQARLIKSVASGNLFLQTYHFALSIDDKVFLEGESSFGYFTPMMMKKQVGLDLGRKHGRLIDVPDFPARFNEMDESNIMTRSILDLSSKIWVNPKGGKYGQGVVIGQHNINPNDWYFKNHFFGDPVMPGSLGVETITRGLALGIRQFASPSLFTNQVLEYHKNELLRWKYRGQVLPENQNTYFESHIKQISTYSGTTYIKADADFWVDDLRIYQIENLSFVLKESVK